MLYGTILHGLLQGALSEQDFTEDKTTLRLEADLSKEERKLEIWGSGLNLDDVKLEVADKAAKGFEVFGNKWVGPVPKASFCILLRLSRSAATDSSSGRRRIAR